MKKMSCRQMGGPCDQAFRADTVDEIIKAGTAHVTEMSAKGDVEHQKVMAQMQAMMNDPVATKKWNEDFTKKFDELPEE